jgi:4'-phosphopantetheinyl transferase
VRACPTCGKPHGRPTLPGTGLSVSVSHSGEWAVVAFAPVEVGVDVELEKPLDVLAVASVLASPSRSTSSMPDPCSSAR